jgi:hypothetical protein
MPCIICQQTNGVSEYESTCQHQHKESEYYLPQKAVKVVNEGFDTNQNKSSEILHI